MRTALFLAAALASPALAFPQGQRTEAPQLAMMALSYQMTEQDVELRFVFGKVGGKGPIPAVECQMELKDQKPTKDTPVKCAGFPDGSAIRGLHVENYKNAANFDVSIIYVAPSVPGTKGAEFRGKPVELRVNETWLCKPKIKKWQQVCATATENDAKDNFSQAQPIPIELEAST